MQNAKCRTLHFCILHFAFCISMKSLRSRLTFTHALVALTAVLIVALLVTILVRVAFDRARAQINDVQIQNSADAVAELLGGFYARRQGWGNVEVLLRRRFNQAPPRSPLRLTRLQLFDAQDQLLFDSATPTAQRQAPPIANPIERPIVVDGATVGRVLIAAPGTALNPAERAFLRGVYLIVLGGSMLAGLAALAVGLVSARRVTTPLRSLTAAARRLAGGQRHEPLNIPPATELAELALAFNSMAAELERQEQLRRQLVADIAHELRTPLSVLRLQIESIEDGIDQPTPATLASLSEEVGLLTRLVDDLRLLSLADAGQLSLSIETLDAGAAAERVLKAAAAHARQQQIELRAELPAEPLAVAADPQRLAQILGNLVENALRYTPAGGQARLRIYADNRPPTTDHRPLLTGENPSSPFVVRPSSFVVFEVVDTGPGIPPDELRQIFERFYRADKARARDTGGSGLGLAIAQRLAEMQGGRVWASSVVGQGATFSVALPASVGAPEPAQAAILAAR
jgi:signal transduction histidine kinase